MKKNYQVRLSRISKYYGQPSESFKQGQIHEEDNGAVSMVFSGCVRVHVVNTIVI